MFSNNKSTSHLSNSSNNAAKTRPWFLWFQVLFFGWRQDSWSGFPANYYTGVVTSFVQSGTEAEKMAAKADSFHYKTDNHRNAKHNSAINQRKFPSNHAQEHKIAVKNRQYWYNRSKHHTNSKHNRAVHVLMPAFITQNLADHQKCTCIFDMILDQRSRVTTKVTKLKCRDNITSSSCCDIYLICKCNQSVSGNADNRIADQSWN